MEIALLDNKKSIKDLVEVDTNKSILEFIEVELSKDEYNFIVTNENLPFAKKQMAELNKSKDFIDTFRKDKVNDESIDIDNFKSNFRDYVALFTAKREEIKTNVEVFERESRDKIAKELSLYADEAIKNAKLRVDFIHVDTADLIKLGSVNPSGSLKKATTETIDGRVLACKSKQDKYDMRLMKLENLSHQSGLKSPLTIVHVQGIIYLDDDAEYESKLDGLISSEMGRQVAVMESLQKEADEKAQREAHQEVLDGQSRINSIFIEIANRSNFDIDSKIDLISNYEYFQFAQLEEFARAKGQMVISELNAFKDSLKPADVVTVNNKEIPVIHETISADKIKEELSKVGINSQEDVYNRMLENAGIETPKVEDGKKVVLIDVKLQFKVKNTIHDSQIVGKVHKLLTDAGFIESLLSVQVVS